MQRLRAGPSCKCKSAWGPEADLDAKVLINLTVEGSMLEAYSHLGLSGRSGLTLGGLWSQDPRDQAQKLPRRQLRHEREEQLATDDVVTIFGT